MNTPDPLAGSWSTFLRPSLGDWQARAAALGRWLRARAERGLLPYDRRLVGAPVPWVTLHERNGQAIEGLNFATADYLGLSTHPLVRQAAVDAIGRHGTLGGGCAALAGHHVSSHALAERLADLTGMSHVFLTSSGWAAGFGALRALVRPGDGVLLDEQAGSGLLEGAAASTRHVHRYRHLDTEHLSRWIDRLRTRTRGGSLFVATPSLFPADGASPDLPALVAACRQRGATLILDVSHDLGCIGPGGTGECGVQSVVGAADVIVGSLAKTFASTGGFVAVGGADAADYLRTYAPPHAFSSAPSPAQVAAATAAAEVIAGPEGGARRAALRRAVLAFRAEFSRRGLALAGAPGPIVTLPVARESIGRAAVRLCAERGFLITLLEPPVAPPGRAALRLQMMAGHEPALAPEVAAAGAAALREAGAIPRRSRARIPPDPED
jgi:7-keto-8-aminopelargonate synthetase-like enzyme